MVYTCNKFPSVTSVTIQSNSVGVDIGWGQQQCRSEGGVLSSFPGKEHCSFYGGSHILSHKCVRILPNDQTTVN